MTDIHSYPENPLIRSVIERVFAILVCSFIIVLGTHYPDLWNDVLGTINFSWIIYYIAWALAFWSIFRMVNGLYMIYKHDKSADI